jgi:electron transfer flavoprotein alpha/beta subunit
MKILVAVKRVVDYNIKVRIKSDGSDVDIEGVKMGINPFDENALEEAFLLVSQLIKMYFDTRWRWVLIAPFF